MSIRKIFADIKQQTTYYWTVYQTDKVMNMYSKEKYDKIISHLKTFNKYKYVKPNDFSFAFFLISENNHKFLDKFLGKINYKQQVIKDYDNPNFLTPYNFAILNNMMDCTKILEQQGSSIYEQGKDGNNLAHIASYYGKTNALQYCIQNKVNLLQQNNNGDTCLHLAIVNQNIEVVQILLNQKLDFLIKNNNNFYPAQDAIMTQNLEIIKLLEFQLQKIDQMELSEFRTVHLAAQLNDHKVLEYFIQKNRALIDIYDNSKTKGTPLHYAVFSKQFSCAEYLLDQKCNVNSQDYMNNTPLHFAIETKDLKIIDLLVQYGADPSIKNNDQKNSLDLCFQERDSSLLKYFRSKSQFAYLFKME